jgi:RNA-directed DNA polymerase
MISDWAGIHPADVKHVLSISDTSQLYRMHTFPKGRRKRRIVYEPVDALMTIQRAVAARLQQDWKPTPWSHAFLPGRSIVTAATPHLGASWMLKFDFKGFFESIVLLETFEALHERVFPDDPGIAWIIAWLCSRKGELPQGAPASPVLSDVVLHPLDLALQQRIGELGCVYARYADDIGISSKGILPKQIATENRRREVGRPIVALVESFGFRIHPDKTRLTGTRQTHHYLGLNIVGDSLRVPSRFVRSVDGMIHAAEAYGLVAARAEHAKRQRRHPQQDFVDVLRGKIEHIGFVQGQADSTYQRFLGRFRALR